LNIIAIIGTDTKKIILGFMIATAFMSMWISNTATSIMMLPIGLAIIAQMRDNPNTPKNENNVFGKALMLSIAYAASIGGISTLIGTPPNLIFAAVVEEMYGIDIGFAQWIKFGFPISIILLFICWWYLTRIAFSFSSQPFTAGREEIKGNLENLGSMLREERIILGIFVLTSFLWITRSFFQNYIPGLDDTIIAMTAGISLFIIPSSKKGQRLIDWDDALKMPWGIFLLFGGGLALAAGFQDSGLTLWIGSQLILLQGLSLFLIILILVAAVNFLTELTSNLATTSMLLPILAPMAIALDVHPYTFMVAATAAASCAFMLPVATPPNAVVFGSGYLRIPDMLKTGIWLNIISIGLICLAVYFLLPTLWGIDLGVNPF